MITAITATATIIRDIQVIVDIVLHLSLGDFITLILLSNGGFVHGQMRVFFTRF
jgi:hypothetical protein